ncbi:uncharacterized protein BDR25DRAFT_377493 [Lindgomyces ingoldianus]|uniref:Uncharacterized protein n=1 Tax=Lindgomyces ingoldianus TaxID=673940 RepID=A0ACB6QJ64_9PLEO|nr:uncharacterized protein BDR25DRAFT_377493 [Lindgomyces ingoldianus]KAF2466362.1 hypothetical protein BDR25DRAFT_377493 [Lindgomyces ingoldianus]
MARQPQAQSLAKEGRLQLALVLIKSNPCLSICAAAAAYNVLESTLQTRLCGILPKRETILVNRKLSPIKEQSLVS